MRCSRLYSYHVAHTHIIMAMNIDNIASFKRDQVRHNTSEIIHHNHTPRPVGMSVESYDALCEREFTSVYVKEHHKISQKVLNSFKKNATDKDIECIISPAQLIDVKEDAYVDWHVDLIETGYSLSKKTQTETIQTIAFAVDLISVLSPFNLSPAPNGELHLTLRENAEFLRCSYFLSLLELSAVNLLDTIYNIIEASTGATAPSNWDTNLKLQYGKQYLDVSGATCQHVHACIVKYRQDLTTSN